MVNDSLLHTPLSSPIPNVTSSLILFVLCLHNYDRLYMTNIIYSCVCNIVLEQLIIFPGVHNCLNFVLIKKSAGH